MRHISKSTARTAIWHPVSTPTNGRRRCARSWRSWNALDAGMGRGQFRAGDRPMDQELDNMFGFAPDYDSPIPYMQRTRDYYKAIGYTTPYRWAHYLQAPFAAVKKPLNQCNVAIVTTAAPYQPDKGDQGPGAAYNGSAIFYQVYSGDTNHDHDLRISHIGYDRVHTTATDSNTWFPLPALRRAATAGRIGRIAPRFHRAPPNRRPP